MSPINAFHCLFIFIHCKVIKYVHDDECVLFVNSSQLFQKPKLKLKNVIDTIVFARYGLMTQMLIVQSLEQAFSLKNEL